MWWRFLIFFVELHAINIHTATHPLNWKRKLMTTPICYNCSSKLFTMRERLFTRHVCLIDITSTTHGPLRLCPSAVAPPMPFNIRLELNSQSHISHQTFRGDLSFIREAIGDVSKKFLADLEAMPPVEIFSTKEVTVHCWIGRMQSHVQIQVSMDISQVLIKLVCHKESALDCIDICIVACCARESQERGPGKETVSVYKLPRAGTEGD